MLTPIRGPAAATPAQGVKKSGRAGAAFALPSAEKAVAAGQVTGGLGLLGLQQGWSDAERDDAAKRRGHAVLEELEGLQLALLSGRIDSGLLARLARLAEGESGADPGLRDILRDISLRARIELARRSSGRP